MFNVKNLNKRSTKEWYLQWLTVEIIVKQSENER